MGRREGMDSEGDKNLMEKILILPATASTTTIRMCSRLIQVGICRDRQVLRLIHHRGFPKLVLSSEPHRFWGSQLMMQYDAKLTPN